MEAVKNTITASLISCAIAVAVLSVASATVIKPNGLGVTRTIYATNKQGTMVRSNTYVLEEVRLATGWAIMSRDLTSQGPR